MSQLKSIYLFPYNKKDFVIILATLLIVIGLPIAVFFFSQSTNVVGRAAGSTVIEAENGTRSGNVTEVADAAASGGKYIRFSSSITCTVNDKLVNSCRPWLGAAVNDYPNTTGFRSDIEDHEQRIGRQVDIAHNFHPAGNLPLSTDEKYFISRANTLLLANWKPHDTFREGDGRNATVNAQIDQVADSIKSVAPKKIFLTLYHEPENDVSGGTTCTTLKGSLGTPAEYRAMWQNVHNRFDAKGVTNVVWVMNYMGFSGWDCIVKDLWPGNDLVDWVMWDPYSASNTGTWNSSVGRFYDWLETNSDATHNFLSKPWGLAEFGIGKDADQPHTYQFYDDARTALINGTFPKLKAYVVFDLPGVHDTQILYTTQTRVLDPVEQEHYKSFANDPRFTDAFYQ